MLLLAQYASNLRVTIDFYRLVLFRSLRKWMLRGDSSGVNRQGES